VLVVDDEPDVQQFLSLVLEDTGYCVDCAADGWEALHKIEANHPDLVVLDLMMPGLDGWGVLRRLRLSSPHPKVVVVSTCADTAQAARAGACACLSKPFLPGELIKTCEKALAA
jgi:CheY-like chemotaxis protein